MAAVKRNDDAAAARARARNGCLFSSVRMMRPYVIPVCCSSGSSVDCKRDVFVVVSVIHRYLGNGAEVTTMQTSHKSSNENCKELHNTCCAPALMHLLALSEVQETFPTISIEKRRHVPDDADDDVNGKLLHLLL